MEVITTIVQQHGRFTVAFDNGEKIVLSRSVFYETDLRENTACDLPVLKQKITVLQYRSALNTAVSMLAQRACSKGEIEAKLKRLQYLPETVEMVIYKLQREGLLNDADFAFQWTESRIAQGRYGKKKIAYELKNKGLNEEQIRNALDETDPDQELDNAVSLAGNAWKRRSTGEDPRKTKQKIFAMLCRRGFDYDMAKQALDRVCNEIEDE